MYIKNVHIENFRNFSTIDIPLQKVSIIIGENDMGKSNLIDAIKMVLYNNSLLFYSKSLGIVDFNKKSVSDFMSLIKVKQFEIMAKIDDELFMKDVLKLLPIIKIKIQFVEAKTSYQKFLLKDWTNQEEGQDITFDVEYSYEPKSPKEFIQKCLFLAEKTDDFILPVECYDYRIYSSNNQKSINKEKAKNFNISIINAERDTFSENDKNNSYRIISTLLEKSLNNEDRVVVEKAYNDFFNKVQDAESFKNIFDKVQDSKEFSNLKSLIDKMKLIPNFPNLKSIFSNINIGYGDEFLYQKGLGTRNLMYLLLLFGFFQDASDKFNILCIEEPEAHLCVNNLNLALDFISKSISLQNDFTQLLITSHNPKIINKLQLSNVIVLKNEKAVSFTNIDTNLVNYLAKRPNFDILKILFAKKLILVEGPTEEIYINTLFQMDTEYINTIEVIAIGQRGFSTFLDLWLKLHENDTERCIGIVRDYDNQNAAKAKHDLYDEKHKNIFVRTTKGYTFENDFVLQGKNKEELFNFFGKDNTVDIADFLKRDKADNILNICEALTEGKITLEVPDHIKEIMRCVREF